MKITKRRLVVYTPIALFLSIFIPIQARHYYKLWCEKKTKFPVQDELYYITHNQEKDVIFPLIYNAYKESLVNFTLDKIWRLTSFKYNN